MLIAKSAIKEFIEKQVKDYRPLKRKVEIPDSRSMLLRLLTSKYGYRSTGLRPLNCQLLAAYIALKYEPQFMFFYDPGLGKSKLVLDILQAIRSRITPGKKRREFKTLILVDNETNTTNFAEQIEEHCGVWPTARVCVLSGSSAERWELLEMEEADYYVIHYAGLIRLLSTPEKKKGSRKKKKLKLNKAAARKFARLFGAVVYDELHNAKDHNSLTFKVCYELSKYIHYRYGLTGTPTGRDPLDFWAQFKIIDHGETLGQHIGLYRAAFFEEERHPFFGWVKWKFDRKKYPQWYRLINNKSLSYEDAEVHDLPRLMRIKVRVPMSPEVKAYYNAAFKILRSAAISKNSDKMAIKTSFMVLRQLASGIIKDDNDKVLFLPNTTLDWIEDKVKELAGRHKIVIFHEFIPSGARLEKMIKKTKIKYARIWGGTKDKKSELLRFQKDRTCRVLITNLKTGGTGLNLQMASRMIMYELPTSVILFRQVMKRCHRTGQRKRVFIYFPIPEGTVLEKQLVYLKSGSDILKAVLSGTEKL